MDIRNFFQPKGDGKLTSAAKSNATSKTSPTKGKAPKGIVPKPSGASSEYFRTSDTGTKRKKSSRAVIESSDEEKLAPARSAAGSARASHASSPSKKAKIEEAVEVVEADPATFVGIESKVKRTTRASKIAANKTSPRSVVKSPTTPEMVVEIDDDPAPAKRSTAKRSTHKRQAKKGVADGDDADEGTDVDEDAERETPAKPPMIKASPVKKTTPKPSPAAAVKMESAANGKSEVKAAIKQEPPSKPAVTIETSKRKLPSTITGEATETPSKRKLPSTITGETTELPIKGKPPSTISGTATETPKRKLPSSISGEGTETPSKRKLPSAVSGDAADETPPAKKKFNPYDYRNKLAAGPSAPGSKEIPEGAQNCLAGLSFVFTGELSSIGRDEATSLVKRYGGRVVGTPSSKTSYVVIGAEPGASKLKKVDDLNLKTVDEDGFLDLIRTLPAKAEFESPAKPKGKGKAATVTKAPARPAKADAAVAAANKNAHNGELWTTKYKPQKYDDVIGNKTLVLQLAKWLGKWEEYRANNFKRQGGDELSDRRAALLSGPPGIGKTTTAHLVAKLEGFDVLEFNASDTRSKKALDDVFRESIGSHAVTEYFGTAVASGAKGRSLADGGHGKRQLVIMDEVDGMSGGDRGGSAELIQLIKKSKVPIICICNDRASPKIKSLANHCADFRFRRPAANQVEARIRAIATVEGLELKPNVVAELVSSTSADIRQILNLLSTYRLSGTVMTFDQSKALAKTSEKNTAVSPFDATAKLFSPGSLNMSLNERIEMYFHDYGLMPLMVQESYVKSKPAIATHLHGNDSRRVALETLACMANAADSISLGDLVDRIQRGTQNWSLMPVHAVLSTVRPCFFTHGGLGGMVGFPSWLGKNSTQTKNGRQLKEVQSHMRLHISGSKSEVRLNYLPALASALTVPLATEGEDAIEDVIQFMDDYYLNKEDRDAVLELGIDKKMAKMAKDIPTSVKTAFTRIYNKSNHPTALLNMSFAKGKKGAGAAGDGVIPDSEDVVEAEEPVVEDDSGEKDDEDNLSDDAALGADKLIVKKAEKGKGTCRPSSASAASSSSSAAKGKAKASGSRKRS